jgi:hypothetical protein
MIIDNFSLAQLRTKICQMIKEKATSQNKLGWLYMIEES